MLNSIETDRPLRRQHTDWQFELNDRPDPRDNEIDDVPLQLTQERIRAESERVGSTELDRSPSASPRATVVPPPAQRDPEPLLEKVRPDPVARQAAGAVSDRPVQTSRPGSILGLDAPLIRAPQPASAWAAASPTVERAPAQVRRPSRTSRALWGAVVVLVLALTAETLYGYLAIRRDSVNLSALPGAATVRMLDAETAGARSKTVAAAGTVYNGARWVAGEARDRYQKWRSR